MDLTGMSGYLPSLLILIAGVVVGGYGYRFFRLSVTLIGAAIGFALGNIVASDVLATLSPALYWVIVGVFTIGIGSVAFAFYKKAIIVICTIGIAYWFVNGYAESSIKNWAIGLGIGFVVGLAVFFLQKAAIMLFTAVAGAIVHDHNFACLPLTGLANTLQASLRKVYSIIRENDECGRMHM